MLLSFGYFPIPMIASLKLCSSFLIVLLDAFQCGNESFLLVLNLLSSGLSRLTSGFLLIKALFVFLDRLFQRQFQLLGGFELKYISWRDLLLTPNHLSRSMSMLL